MTTAREQNAPSGEARPTFARSGHVSLWLSTVPLVGVPDGYLDGAPEVLAWLFVDFGVAVDGAFSTNYAADRQAGPLRPLLEPLHESERFIDAALAEADARGLDEASFVLGLYDLDYDPTRVGLPIDCGTPSLRFLGSFLRR
ncbi:MAG: hypothetical protein RIF41_40645 [Polyangiaceae bacterium]